MARIPRLTVDGEPAVYHVISRTALGGFVLGDVEKEYLLSLIQRLSAVYFTEVLGFCLMGNHFHLLVRIHPEVAFSDDDIRTRFQHYYGADSKRKLMDGQIPTLRAKWASSSEYVKEIKQSFSRWYNKRHGRTGFFWGERFKSVLVENGDTLINCLAYIDLNPVRAGLVERPEDYRWCSLTYHVQTGNKDAFLSLDFGLATFSNGDAKTRLHESSVIGYLTARLSRDLIVASHQQLTQEWWAIQRHKYDLFISQTVIEEAAAGDQEAAQERLAVLAPLPLLELTEEAVALAKDFIRTGPLPQKAEVDALHIAIAVTNRMDYLLTWNCKHIANAAMRSPIEQIGRARGYEPTIICTPEELMED